MNWLKLNLDCEYPDHIVDLTRRFKRISNQRCDLIYEPRIWDLEPIVKNDELNESLMISGWFVIDDQLNNIDLLYKKIKTYGIKQALQYVEAGVFIGLFKEKEMEVVFNDFFGLSSHYYAIKKSEILLSPSAKMIANVINAEISLEIAGIINNKGHCFGSETKYIGVKKLLPGTIISSDGREECYIDFDKVKKIELSAIPDYIEKLTSLFKKKDKFVALSAGFDSRLLALKGDVDKSYTWGPDGSKDIKNADIISKELKLKHHKFLFKKNVASEMHKEINEWLFDGQNKLINSQFTVNYEYASKVVEPAFVSLDGYLGDVLQRGVYLYASDVKGEIQKLIPQLVKKESSESILRRRYKVLNDEQFLLVIDYVNKTKNMNLDCDEVQFATVYEFIFGRGFSAMSCGGVVMNGLFNIVLPLFATPTLFKSCIEADVNHILNYKAFKEIWNDMNGRVVEIRSEGFYSPKTEWYMIPYFNIIGRIATNYIPMFYNYGKE